jgi:hypothetical protein
MAQDEYPKVEIFGGYQYFHNGQLHIAGQDVPNSSENWNGWDTSVTGNFTKHLGVTGDFSGNYKTFDNVAGSGVNVDGRLYTFAGGPVVSYDAGGKINPFVHALFGGAHASASAAGQSLSHNVFIMMFGGGVDAKVAKHIKIRPIEFDWIYYHSGSFNVNISGFEVGTLPSFSQANNVRITSGIVFTF